MRNIKKIAAVILIATAALFIIKLIPSKSYTASELGLTELCSPLDADGDKIDDWHDIMLGARTYIETDPSYKSRYYEGGYPDDGYGVCTDVVWQGFAAAGYDLKSLVDSHIAENPELYPDEADPNIDFRRVKNLSIFFEQTAQSLTIDTSYPEEWQPGDIVVYENHIAICSDKRNRDGLPFIIHHGPLGAREADELESKDIIGHYRWLPDD